MGHEVSASGTPGFYGFDVFCSCGGWVGYKGGPRPNDELTAEEWAERSKQYAAQAWTNHVNVSRQIESYAESAKRTEWTRSSS